MRLCTGINKFAPALIGDDWKTAQSAIVDLIKRRNTAMHEGATVDQRMCRNFSEKVRRVLERGSAQLEADESA